MTDNPKNILALEASAQTCSVALSVNGEVQQLLGPAHNKHSQSLLDLALQILAENSTSIGQLDFISFGKGPGSFTGIRVCAAVAQGLAVGAAIKLLPISSLAALSLKALRLHDKNRTKQEKKLIVPVLDARINQVYWACYALDDELLIKSVFEDRLDDYDAAARQIKACIGNQQIIMTGEGVELLELEDWPVNRQYIETQYPEAIDVLNIALKTGSSDSLCAAENALPVYLRDSSAWKKQNQPPKHLR